MPADGAGDQTNDRATTPNVQDNPDARNTPNMTSYQQARREFSWDVADDYNFALDTIGAWAEDPDKLAMLWVGQDGREERYTFVHFDE